ncbi:BTAD domain-containing putative transcriptional regulator [Actinoplanes sp. Pm04-4]|uniref:BTAD domain-containing putative transcriptional regulator n=1 Tax=Paractinoplanes pyxinae TaxID=2997416 RepID=A0ABT4AQZ6_9ACTN|nr:BTAD domain-containing putative transcriptional regulator [Actinoplanes pyxinae]MCY1136668.1 BTAD domain-containing putative transcriptional regulator [Actinoplanes pyxinae]
MGLTVHLLGSPWVDRPDGVPYQVRSRKSWALLACLVLSERPLTRSRLAGLLYQEADDPLRALRWGLAEIRRCLGVEVDGDPVVLRLPPGAVVDVDVLRHGSWAAAVDLPGLGADLLDGIAVRGAPAFESWLLSERRRIAAAAEAILHEAALGRLAAGDLVAARGLAVRAAGMNPLEENHQALVIRLYRLAGDDRAAEKQYRAVAELFARELGVRPGAAVEAAMAATRESRPEADDASLEAIVESGAAAVAAGSVEAGVRSLRTAVRLADRARSDRWRLAARVRLAEALIHSLRGLDEEGLAFLHEADRIALAVGERAVAAQARAEIGYVDFLRARYDRAERWLTDALSVADGSPAITARVSMYLGSVESDRAFYPKARLWLEKAIGLAADARTEAYALSMLGRMHLLTGNLDEAAARLDESTRVAERDHWLAFVPWPQAMRGETFLAAGNPAAATRLLQQAFARACQIGDPCWEGMAARSLALVADAAGDPARAFDLLADARTRSNRLADPYVWLDAYILDAQCDLGRRHDHPETQEWAGALRRLAARTGMREMTVHALRHCAGPGDEEAAALLAGVIAGRPDAS